MQSDQVSIPQTGFLRVVQIIGRPANPTKGTPGIPPLIPVGRTKFWEMCKGDGTFPRPIYPFGPRTPVWRVEDVIDYLNRITPVAEAA
ncbi:MAG TPA: transcriptional regulator [Arenimonas sp.]|uniref:helix-turn-helix transcriptional regulator n=1 Tax=Arenimonas sp. TaxID=1872635 RepID=UPI002CDD84EE|nr:transcriptional regulator [Arenimonas sp.]HMB57818.1 transcriptional regulator [Arenimonas sp.]